MIRRFALCAGGVCNSLCGKGLRVGHVRGFSAEGVVVGKLLVGLGLGNARGGVKGVYT